MPDPRFFENLGPISLSELAAKAGATLKDPGAGSRSINGVAVLDGAGPDVVTFLSDRRRKTELAASSAGACFVTEALADAAPASCAVLVAASPQAAYAVAARTLHRPRAGGAPPELESDVVLGPSVVMGAGAKVGRGTRIGANSVIGPGVAIGRDCVIGANVTIGFALIGDRVNILAGAVIGEAGFGATAGASGLIDIPQLGRVIIQDNVTVGANSCIDRGAYDDTVVGENTKIDNLVHIAHNVRLGRNCALAAFTGISGSVVVGDGVAFGGRAGVVDHVTIGAGARVAAASGVMKNIPAGETWGGQPARPIRRWMRDTAWVSRMASRRDQGAGE